MLKKAVDQKTLAAQLDLSQASISKIINGKQYLDFDLAVKACEFLDITLEWLAYGRETGTGRKPYYANPERQRIEYLMSIIDDTEYEAVIVCLERIIRLRIEPEDADETDDKKGREAETG
jgi:transcriptional regulator with XRE-family HTH domain